MNGRTDTTDYGSRIIVLIAAILAFRLVALALNGTDLYFDESQYWSWSTEPAFGYYSKPPLIAWLIAASTSLCGDGEACIRFPSVLIHAGTTYLVFVLGRRLYSARTGFWAALAYATLPGVSVSSGIISTDVPLLFAWALALVGLSGLLAPKAFAVSGDLPAPWTSALALGLALAIGLNAKYAMAYIVLSTAIYLWIEPRARPVLRTPKLWLAVALGLVAIAPNLLWNAAHSFATFSHTADNAKWDGQLFNPGKAAEFILAQFGVFGPILFGTLLALLWRRAKGRLTLEPQDRFLLAYALPVIAVVTVQAFISRAHPNWAAIAYVPAVVLVTDYMLRAGEEIWARRSLMLHAGLAVVIALATWQAGRFSIPGIGDPFQRTLGNRELAAATSAALAAASQTGKPYGAILTDDRELTASLLYYLRAEPTPLFAWRGDSKPRDHFELTRAYGAKKPEPVLLVSRKADPSGVTGAFATVEAKGPQPIQAGRFSSRNINYFALSGYRSP